MERLLENPPPSTISVAGAVNVLLKRLPQIVAVAGVIFALSLAANLLRSDYYVARGTILPNGSQGVSGMLGSLAASVPGLELLNRQSEPRMTSQLFPDILRSDLIIGQVLHALVPSDLVGTVAADSIMQLFGEDETSAVEGLRAATTVGRDKITGVVSVAVRHRSPEAACFIAAEYLRKLDDYCSSERFVRLDQDRRFVAERLEEAEGRLRSVEDSLLQFRQQNRNFYSATDPELQLEHERLVRKVAEVGQVQALLRQQLELATIEARRRQPVVTVLDYPTVPRIKAGPHRLTNTLQLTLAALLLACGWVITADYVRKNVSNTEAEQLRAAQQEFRNRMSRLPRRLRLKRGVDQG